MDSTELKWDEFKQTVEIHRSYLELSIKINMFYYAITGAILSFYFTHTHIPMAKYALGLPILLSLALATCFLWSAKLSYVLRAHIRSTANELGFKTYPEGIVLVIFCVMFGIILLLVSATLIWLFATA